MPTTVSPYRWWILLGLWASAVALAGALPAIAPEFRDELQAVFDRTWG